MAVNCLTRFLFLYTVKIGRNRLFSVAKVKRPFYYTKEKSISVDYYIFLNFAKNANTGLSIFVKFPTG